jgi:hypothetical protein
VELGVVRFSLFKGNGRTESESSCWFIISSSGGSSPDGFKLFVLPADASVEEVFLDVVGARHQNIRKALRDSPRAENGHFFINGFPSARLNEKAMIWN